jgi:hypothetical protein
MISTFVVIVLLLIFSFLILPIFLAGTKMLAAVVFLVTPVNDVLLVAALAYPFKLVFAETRRQITMADDSPWSLAMHGPVPSTITEQVVGIPGVEKIVGQADCHKKAECPWQDKLSIILDTKHRRGLMAPLFLNDKLLRLITQVYVQIDSDIASMDDSGPQQQDDHKQPFTELFHVWCLF